MFSALTVGYFRQYDYGFVKNLQIYKTKSPPAYNLSNVQVPIGLFHGYNDLLAATAVLLQNHVIQNKLLTPGNVAGCSKIVGSITACCHKIFGTL